MLILGTILALLTLLLIKIDNRNRKLIYISAISFLVGPLVELFYRVDSGNSEKVFGHLYSNIILTPQLIITVFIPFGLVITTIVLSHLSIGKKSLLIFPVLGLGYLYLLITVLLYAPGVGL